MLPSRCKVDLIKNQLLGSSGLNLQAIDNHKVLSCFVTFLETRQNDALGAQVCKKSTAPVEEK